MSSNVGQCRMGCYTRSICHHSTRRGILHAHFRDGFLPLYGHRISSLTTPYLSVTIYKSVLEANTNFPTPLVPNLFDLLLIANTKYSRNYFSGLFSISHFILSLPPALRVQVFSFGSESKLPAIASCYWTSHNPAGSPSVTCTKSYKSSLKLFGRTQK